MPDFTVEVEFEVYCDKCGAGLCNQSTVVRTYNRGANAVRVMPCETCLGEARDEGYEQGVAAGGDDA